MSSVPANAASYRHSKLAKDLLNQLHIIPKLASYEHKIEIILFKSLFFALSNYNKYYAYFFHDDNDFHVSYPTNWDDVNDVFFNKYFYLDQEESNTKSHQGHICALSIPVGAKVYNCYDCGVDPTCCLCENCFNPQEHSDHNVSVHRSSGDAICDCGDIDSWKNSLDCVANKMDDLLKSKLKPLPKDFENSISTLIRVLIDFILDVQLTNIQTLPLAYPGGLSKSNFLSRVANVQNTPDFDASINTYNWEMKKLNKDYEPNVLYTNDSDEYHYLIVWNDEFHNFDEAIRFLTAAHVPTEDFDSNDFVYFENDYNNVSDFKANGNMVENMAKLIDQKGYICYSRSKNVADLNAKAAKFDAVSVHSNENLQYSIINGRTYFNLVLVNSIFNWFEYILKNKNTILTDFIKHELTNVLFEKADFHLDEVPMFDEIKLDGEIQPCMLSKHLKIPILHDDLAKPALNTNEICVGGDADLTTQTIYPGDISRLQYLVFFEIRLSKATRKLIKKIILPLISNTTETRWIFAKQILQFLPTYEYNVAFNDREWHLSFIETFRLQVYHDPNVGTQLLNNGLFKNIIESLFISLRSSSVLKAKRYHVNRSPHWKTRRSTSSISKAIEGLSTIIKFVHPGTLSLFEDHLIVNILRLFSIYEELFPLVRRADIHEEIQDRTTCGLYHASLIPIQLIAENIGNICNGSSAPTETIEKSIALISTFLKSKERKYNKELGIVDFDISNDGVSMCHPVGFLLAHISRSYKFFQPSLLLNSVSLIRHTLESGFSFAVDSTPQISNFMGVADEMLQPWVYHAQIASNFWVRNGIYVLYADKYFDSYKPENYLYIIQQGILLDQLPIEDIINRYMLTACINADTSFDDTIYEEKMSIILKEFMQLMYYLLTSRVYYDSCLSNDDVLRLTNEATLASILAPRPLKYSELEEMAYSCPHFEEIIETISIYTPPSNYKEYGHYAINPDYAEKIDPFNYFAANLGTSDIEEAVIKIIAEKKGKKSEDVILTPYLHELEGGDLQKFKKIGEFMKTAKFAKLLYKILRYAIVTDNDAHLNVTLQLIHAIILDDRLYHSSDNHGLKYFIEIPICNMLLTAAEKSEFPKYVSKKASTVLELLLLKDDNVLISLMDCFGREHIEEYKKSKHGKGLETNIERKKRLALKRQRKVLKKMMKQQNQFVDNNRTFFDDGKDSSMIKNEKADDLRNEPSVNEYNQELRTCLLCKNPEGTDSVFGTPAFVSTSSVFWNIPTIYDDPPDFMVEELRPYVTKAKKILKNGRCLSYCTREKLVIDGCPHGMHLNCFKEMLGQKNMSMHDFLCPLCKGKSNAFVPSLKSRDFEVDPVGYEKINYTQEKINAVYGDNIASLSSQIYDKEMFKILSNPDGKEYKEISIELNLLKSVNQFFNSAVPVSKLDRNDDEKLKDGYYRQFIAPLLIGSTLEMEEIVARGKKEDFEISEIANSTLRSLLQFRILINYSQSENAAEEQKQYQYLIHNPYVGFTETIMLLFTESAMPLVDCIKFSLVKRIFYICMSIFERNQIDSHNLEFNSLLDPVEQLGENSVVYQTLCNIMRRAVVETQKFKNFKFDINGSLIQKAYQVLITNHKNYTRQVQFICKFLKTIPLDTPLIPSIDEILTTSFSVANDENKFFTYIGKEASVYLREKQEDEIHKRDGMVDVIEYPKSIHFIDLPEKLKDIAQIATDKKEKYYVYEDDSDHPTEKIREFEHVCLHCGKWLTKIHPHRSKCTLSSYATMIFTPVKNQITLLISPLVARESFVVESPYLNKHGEPSKGIIGFGDSGTLSVERYKHLQEAYYNQSMIRDLLRNKPPLSAGAALLNLNVIPGIIEPEEILRLFRQEREGFGGNARFIPNNGVFNFATTIFTNIGDMEGEIVFSDDGMNGVEDESDYFEDGDDNAEGDEMRMTGNPDLDELFERTNAAADVRDNSIPNNPNDLFQLGTFLGDREEDTDVQMDFNESEHYPESDPEF